MTWGFEIDKLENWAYMDGVFTPEECQKIIDLGNSKEKKEATIVGDKAVDHEIRKNKVVWLEPEDQLDWAYQRLTDAVIDLNKKFFNFELWGFTEKLQFTEYSEEYDGYKLHIDKLYYKNIRKLSIVVQLSSPDDYEGCELELHYGPTPDVMPKKQGTMVAFPSYTLHEVKPLLSGKRYSLVAWLGGKAFR